MNNQSNTIRNTQFNNKSDTQKHLASSGFNTDIFERYLSISMWYEAGLNNVEIGKARMKMTILIAVRFNLVSPTILSELYSISLRQAKEHLNKLVKQKLLQRIATHRSVDGCVYICDRQGAKWAEEHMSVTVPFKRYKHPEMAINQNNIMHDLINVFLMLRLLHETSLKDENYYQYRGLMTEVELKRHLATTNIRIADGLLAQPTNEGDINIALEVEHAYKNPQYKEKILLRQLNGIKSGVFDKIFIASQKHEILEDIKRTNIELLETMPTRYNKKARQPLMTESDAELLRNAIVYRTKYCDDLRKLFYS
ncbi:hypothetical protein CXF95_01360 [Paraglaciecola sp. MB-3u-78]|nr:hypothetical protein CXF95_01360 [Paraglaciecola sp. MB-3u-78]